MFGDRKIGRREIISSLRRFKDLQIPDLNNFVDEYWRMRLRRTVQTWKTNTKPKVVTHLLKNEDDIIRNLTRTGLTNNPDDKVKIVYHPDFIVSTNPLFGLDYGQFVRGCHLGVFLAIMNLGAILP